MKSLYISRVKIKNFRNFKYVDVLLGHKAVIIGENNVGKTNFLRALQLILDPSLSDEDRNLEETDFNENIENPMENGEIIEVSIYISNYSNNKTILAVLSDATITEDGEEKLLITYRFEPIQRDDGKCEYEFHIFKGGDETKKFDNRDRKYLNLKVIKALRDVENELRNTKISPINKLLKQYDIDKEELKRIAESYKITGQDVLSLDEIIDLTNNINSKFSKILGTEDFNVSLKTLEVEPNKILSSLKLLMDKRNTSDVSLGVNNILYISLILQLLQDKTIPTYLNEKQYVELEQKENSGILSKVYSKSEKNNYFLKNNLTENENNEIYNFMARNYSTNEGVTILAIEEPEAHLHPTYQRLIYRDVIRNSDNSVLLTTHSTHITSITPIASMVNIHYEKNESKMYSTRTLNLTEKELIDIERYIDVKRGEIYLGKGVLLVEGITEEYLIPKFAELIGKCLDERGIIICNVDSTDFLPYAKLLKNLNIPYAIITDGDFYCIEDKDGEKERKYHILQKDNMEQECGWLGVERIKDLIIKLGLKKQEEIEDNIEQQEETFSKLGMFIGNYTIEVDIMEKSQKTEKKILCEIFNELTSGGERQKNNFKSELETGEYWKCLNKIENNNIGKGRYAQRLSTQCMIGHIPDYIKNAINYICKEVKK